MAAYEFAPGSTGVSIFYRLRGDSDAQAKKGLTATSPGAQAGYTRQGGTPVNVPLVALGSPDAAWQAGGFIECDPTIVPGIYRFDVPNAAVAEGVNFTALTLNFTGVLGEGALIILRNPIGPAGAGSLPWTITVNNSLTGDPLPGASVWVSTDSAGTNVIAGALSTNASGQVQFFLDAGSYFLWVQDERFTNTNPTPFVVA